MNFDGFLYVFALIGIITTAVAASLGIALTLTLARFTYVRLKLTAPFWFFPVDGNQQKAQQRDMALNEQLLDPASKYSEKTRMSPVAK